MGNQKPPGFGSRINDLECAARLLCASSAERSCVCGGTLSVTPYGVPDSPFCRCATFSPGRGKSFLEGGAYLLQTVRSLKAPPSGELAATNGSRLRGLGCFRFCQRLPLGGAAARSAAEGVIRVRTPSVKPCRACHLPHGGRLRQYGKVSGPTAKPAGFAKSSPFGGAGKPAGFD